MFITRLLSGIVLVLILLLTGILGGSILWGFCLAISLIGLYEFYKVFKIEKTMGIVGYGVTIVYYLSLLLYKGTVNGVLFLAIGLMADTDTIILSIMTIARANAMTFFIVFLRF